jgi:hypothetical protein
MNDFLKSRAGLSAADILGAVPKRPGTAAFLPRLTVAAGLRLREWWWTQSGANLSLGEFPV